MLTNRGRGIAALLVAATIAAPASALADSMQAPMPMPTPIGPTEPGVTTPLEDLKVKLDRAEAIAIARRTFAIPQELGEPNVSLNQSQDHAVWSLTFQTPSKQAERISISVEVDANLGVIRGYSRWASNPSQEPGPLTYTRSEAEQKAKDWLAMLAPALRDSLRPVEEQIGFGYYYGGADAVYQFRWTRVAQGYPARFDGLSIGIDARTGELREFYRGQWGAQQFELPAEVLSQDKAEAIYLEQLGMVAQYQYFRQPGTEKGEWRLVYKPLLDLYPSITQDGKLVDGSGQPIDLAQLKGITPVPASEKSYKAPAKELTREEALALAKAAAGKQEEPTNANYSEYGEETKVRTWEFSWHSQSEKGEGESTSVRIDVTKGIVLSYNNWGPYVPAKEGEEPKVSLDEARTMAIEFIRTHRPDLSGKVAVLPSYDPYLRIKMGGEPIRNHYIRFAMLQNGIPVPERALSIDVDAMTGKIRSFWANEMQADDKFPAAAGLIGGEAAMKAYLQHQGLELAWVQYWQAQPMPMEAKAEQQRVDLVWAPGQRYALAAIDALTGAPLDHQGRDLIEAAKRPTDIEGHFAQREIELLWARGIFDLKDGKFNPAQQVTAAELARWLVLSRGMQPYMAYDFGGNFARTAAAPVAAKLAMNESAAYFGAALQNGIILPEDFAADTDPEGPVSRELFALWSARAMGYSAVARMGNQIQMPFVDKAEIGAKYANAVALLHGLGVISGDESASFAPQRNLNRGEAAKILFAVTSHVRR